MRKSRHLEDGATYHVSAKINRGEYAFENDEIKNLFLEIIKRAKKKYLFSIQNFVIMGNHIHFLIKPKIISESKKYENLSRIMQWILSVFAMYFNKINKLTGHLWNSRFFSKIIDNIKQFLDTFKYISDNPVKANIIDKAENYRYGGMFYILRKIFDIIDKSDFDFGDRADYRNMN